MNDYKLLNKVEDYDLPTVKELVAATNELAQMEQRRAYLEDLIRVNGKLKKFIWKDPKSGYAVAIADLTDDHLRNLVNWHKKRYNFDIPQTIIREISRRGIDLNPNPVAAYLIEPPEPSV